MLSSLYARLALALVLLVLLLSFAFLLVSLQTGKLYSQELNQQLNFQLAENLIKENNLSIDQGRFDATALEHIFHTYMVVNPSIEVYLLDAQGKILSYSAPPGTVKLEQVNLAPVQAFLNKQLRLPIIGDDPRDSERKKVFSVAPIGLQSNPQGYLYVVLAGQQLESVASLLQGSYILRLGISVLLLSALAGLVGGLWLLHRVTRRLRRLDEAMMEFENAGFSGFRQHLDFDTKSRDELGRLGRSFNTMAQRISSHIGSLQQTDALRRELVANVSHDLRTPIASLQGYLETLLIKEDSLDEVQRREYIVIALRHSERLGKLVSELFELAKLDSGHTEVHPEAFAPGELVQDVMMKYQLLAQKNDINLIANIPENLPFVHADIGLIERVLANLLDNALEHTPANGQVELNVFEAEDAVRIEVADNGSGIPREELPFVFDRFYQVNKSERQASGGVGLGLAIAKRIMDLHTSSIEVFSEPHSGTRFDFSLPVYV